MNYQTLTLAEEGGIALLTFNRPAKRNAISYELIDELLAALKELENGSTRVLLLTGAGSSFCAGMDLENLKTITSLTAAENRKDSETMARLFRSIYEFPRPTIAAVNGAAMARRVRHRHAVRLYHRFDGGEVWLYGGADRVSAGDCLIMAGSPDRGKSGTRAAADRTRHLRRRGPAHRLDY